MTPFMMSGLEEFVDANARAKMSCYNCGAQTHYGHECKENTLEEMTKCKSVL